MKGFNKFIASVFVVVILIILFFTFASPFIDRIDLWSRIGLSRTKKQQVNTFTELLEQRNLSELETASYYTELIFPFDFLAREFPRTADEWERLRRKAEGNASDYGSYRTGVDAIFFKSLNEDEKKNYLFLDTVSVWLDMTGRNRTGSNQFINIDNPFDYLFRLKVRASAGFELSGSDWISRENDLITIRLPDPKILNMSVIVDPKEPWPDVAINPYEFGKLLTLLENNMIQDMVWKTMLKDGEENSLSMMAMDNGERLIRRMIPNDFDVVFINKKQEENYYE